MGGCIITCYLIFIIVVNPFCLTNLLLETFECPYLSAFAIDFKGTSIIRN